MLHGLQGLPEVMPQASQKLWFKVDLLSLGVKSSTYKNLHDRICLHTSR